MLKLRIGDIEAEDQRAGRGCRRWCRPRSCRARSPGAIFRPPINLPKTSAPVSVAQMIRNSPSTIGRAVQRQCLQRHQAKTGNADIKNTQACQAGLSSCRCPSANDATAPITSTANAAHGTAHQQQRHRQRNADGGEDGLQMEGMALQSLARFAVAHQPVPFAGGKDSDHRPWRWRTIAARGRSARWRSRPGTGRTEPARSLRRLPARPCAAWEWPALTPPLPN